MYTIGYANRCTHRGPLFDNSTTAHEPTVESLDRFDQKVLSVFEAFGADNTDKTLRILSLASNRNPTFSRSTPQITPDKTHQFRLAMWDPRKS